MNAKKNIIGILLFLSLFFLVASAGSLCASKFSPLIFSSSNVDEFDKQLSAAHENNCVIIQVERELFDEKKARVLLDWVERGGTLWFYDSRLAHFFGMKESPFKAEDFPSKEMKGEYGSKKEYAGIAIGCEAWGNHNITIGIRKVIVFVLKVDNEMYSAVQDEEGVIPLLKIKRDNEYSISALRSLGAGKIIFKPLLWEDKFDGRDFQRKLMKSSSKKPVPFIKE